MKTGWEWVQPIRPIDVNELPPGEKRFAKELARLVRVVRSHLREPCPSPRGRDRVLQEIENAVRRLTEPKNWWLSPSESWRQLKQMEESLRLAGQGDTKSSNRRQLTNRKFR
jgi:hypothetical protein